MTERTAILFRNGASETADVYVEWASGVYPEDSCAMLWITSGTHVELSKDATTRLRDELSEILENW